MSKMNKNSAGIVSIMVTTIMMIVISLIVLGFAEISRTEQRSSLDTQLSTQAYYAAESGINDARAVLNSLIAGGQTPTSKTSCGPQGTYTSLDGTSNAIVSSQYNVSYTCLLINPSPTSLVYSVGYSSTVIPIISNTAAFGSLSLTWTDPSGQATAAGCYTIAGSLGSFPVASGSGQWGCDYPVLRIDLVDANGSLARPNWQTDTSTMFFVPFDGNGVGSNAIDITGGPVHGALASAKCGSTCSASIIGVGGTRYYMRVTTLYRSNSKLTISSVSGNIPFIDAQATIDATGKAQDVLRRILVGIDLTNANANKLPSGALVTEYSVCKRFGATNGSFNIYDDLTAGGGGNPQCSPQAIGAATP